MVKRKSPVTPKSPDPVQHPIRVAELQERLRKHKAGELKGRDRMSPSQVKAAKVLIRFGTPAGKSSKRRLPRSIEKAVKDHVTANIRSVVDGQDEWVPETSVKSTD